MRYTAPNENAVAACPGHVDCLFPRSIGGRRSRRRVSDVCGPTARRRPRILLPLRNHADRSLTDDPRRVGHFRSGSRHAPLLRRSGRSGVRSTKRSCPDASISLRCEISDHGRRHQHGSGKGIGPRAFSALAQFAETSRHPELASTNVFLLGFSGTGALVGRFPEYAPDRVLAVIASDPGHGESFGVDTINLSKKAAAVPQLILVGSDDAVSGTERPYAYFRKYF